MRWLLPWLSARVKTAETAADAAEADLQDAHTEHEHARQLAAEARQIARTNGFTQAVRDAFYGVSQ